MAAKTDADEEEKAGRLTQEDLGVTGASGRSCVRTTRIGTVVKAVGEETRRRRRGGGVGAENDRKEGRMK